MTDTGPLHLDLETRSAANLKTVGAHRYAEDPSTRIILGSYRFGAGPVGRWVGEGVPSVVFNHVADGGRVVGHNATFERALWNARVGGGNVRMLPQQQDCTMARGQAMGLPASLDNLGKALNAAVTKDKDGYRLMMRMCKPKAGTVDEWHEDPADIERLGVYCDQDVLAECAVDAALPPLSERERRIWELNQTLNDRGVAIDLPLAAKAQSVVEYAKKAADARMWRLTGGAVKTCSQTAKIVEWLAARGIPCTSVADGETEELLAGAELFDDDAAIEVINLRRASVKAFKFPAMLAAACQDGRVRGTIAYHAAHTGRDAGRIIQPQNFKRLDDDAGDPEKVRMAVKLLTEGGFVSAADAHDALELVTGDVLETLSVCARAMIIAGPGNTLIWGDFSNIEGRVAAWLAGAAWKLQAFRDYDAGTGPDLYKVTAAKILNKAVEDVTKTERQVSGKVTELACGYQGMLNALKKMAAKQKGLKVPDAALLAAGRGWRAENPEIVASWRELEDAVIDAVSNPGVVVSVMGDRVRYVVSGDLLHCRLPSTRIMSYAQPRVAWTKKIVTIDGEEVTLNKRAVSYWGTHQGRFMKQDLYGGSEFNHVVQGTARDILYSAALRVEAAGYKLVLPVHDELVTEAPKGFGSASEVESLMSQPELWFAGLPLATKAQEGDRYDK